MRRSRPFRRATPAQQEDGPLDIEPYSSWSSKWVRMTPEERDSRLAAAAHEPLLMTHQVSSILQGIPPDLGRPYEPTYFDDEVAPFIERLKSDVQAGRIAMPCTPRELHAWCSDKGIDLPHPFLSALGPTVSPVQFQTVPVPVSPAPTTKPSRSGRASTIRRDQTIQDLGLEIAQAMAARGESVKKRLVVDQISPQYPEITPETIERILSKAGIDWPGIKEGALEARSLKRK